MADGKTIKMEMEMPHTKLLAISLKHVIQRARLWCTAADMFVFVTAALQLGDLSKFALQGQWVGPVPPGISSKAPNYSPAKVLELLLASLESPQEGVLVMTPLLDYIHTLGLMGGARYCTKGVDLTIGVSKLAQEWDKLLAVLLACDALIAPLQLHHVGFKYPTEAAFIGATSLYPGGMVRDASDHKRVYIPQKGPGGQHYYRELQWFPNAPTWEGGPRKHFDFVTPHPRNFLGFLAAAFGQQPEFWEGGPNDPVGGVSILDVDGDPLTVMARSKGWKVEKG